MGFLMFLHRTGLASVQALIIWLCSAWTRVCDDLCLLGCQSKDIFSYAFGYDRFRPWNAVSLAEARQAVYEIFWSSCIFIRAWRGDILSLRLRCDHSFLVLWAYSSVNCYWPGAVCFVFPVDVHALMKTKLPMRLRHWSTCFFQDSLSIRTEKKEQLFLFSFSCSRTARTDSIIALAHSESNTFTILMVFLYWEGQEIAFLLLRLFSRKVIGAWQTEERESERWIHFSHVRAFENSFLITSKI